KRARYNGIGRTSSKQINKIFKYNIYGREVTWKNIKAAIDSISINAKAEDYFFFMFAGLTLQTVEGTYFMPYISHKSNILINNSKATGDSALNFIRQQGFSLKQLAERLELIPAKNQLIISEAGASSNFAREMVSILRASKSDIYQLSARNRVIIVPANYGLDPGPIARWIKEMSSSEISIFNLFSEKKWVDVLKYFYDKDPDNYATIFFESQFFKQLNELGQSQNRGLPSDTPKPDSAFLKNDAKTYGLLIGINDFPKGWPAWTKLQNPLNDIRAITNELNNSYKIETQSLENISTDSIVTTLQSYSKKLRPNDQLLIYVATHGDLDTTFYDDGFLVGSNTLPKQKDPARHTYLNYAQLSGIINNLPSRHVLFMSDVCYGGAFDKHLIAQNKKREENQLTEANQQFLAENYHNKARQFISSAMLKPVPDADLVNFQHSPFAIKFLNALRLKKQLLTAQQIFGLIQENLSPIPVYSTFGKHAVGAEFVLIGKN
ncbi:MAG TPA: caspase family protein, partial [Emticicia sp.]